MLAERILAADRREAAQAAVGHHHLVDGRETGGQQSLLPVAVKAEHRAQVAQPRHALVVSIVDEQRQFLRAELHPHGFPHQHGACGILTVAHVELQRDAGERERFLVNIQLSVEERVVGVILRRDGHHVLRAVANLHRHVHLHVVQVQLFLAEQERAVLHHVENRGLHRASYYLHAERVRSLRTHDAPPAVDGHAVRMYVAVVARLVHVGHGLRDIDELLALLGRLAVETAVLFGRQAVVVGNFADGNPHNPLRVAHHHHHVVQHHRVGCQLHVHLLSVAGRGQPDCLVSDVRESQLLRSLLGLDAERSFIVRHGRDMRARNTDVHRLQGSSGRCILHNAVHHIRQRRLHLCAPIDGTCSQEYQEADTIPQP